jgi:hypothetical protein
VHVAIELRDLALDERHRAMQRLGRRRRDDDAPGKDRASDEDQGADYGEW